MKAFERHYPTHDHYSRSALEMYYAQPLQKTPYAPYVRMRSCNDYPIASLIAAIETAMGERIAHLLLSTDAEAVTQVMADVLVEWSHRSSIDIQLMFMVNAIKEIAHQRSDVYGEQSQIASDLIRRCTLGVQFKNSLIDELIRQRGLMTSKIIHINFE